MRWTRAAHLTNRADAEGEVVWFCRLDAGVKSCEKTRETTVTNKPGRRGEREVSRKTIARGMPGVSGVTVVTTLVCFVLFRTRGCGCIERPAFPAPSDFSGAGIQSKTRAANAARS